MKPGVTRAGAAAQPLLYVDHADVTPIYAQLERAIRAAIATGRVRAGDRLPTVRQLAVALRLNANTVARVYGELERSGVLETRRGVGSFVRGRAAEARPRQEHARRLRAFAAKVLSDAHAAGFSSIELASELDAQSKRRTIRNR